MLFIALAVTIYGAYLGFVKKNDSRAILCAGIAFALFLLAVWIRS
jgi:hypothetical protein